MQYRNFTWRRGEGTNSRTFYKYIDVKLLLVLFSSYWRFLITFKINLASEDFDILIFWRFLDSISKDTNMFFVKFFGKSIVCFSSHSWKITILFDLKKIYYCNCNHVFCPTTYTLILYLIIKRITELLLIFL